MAGAWDETPHVVVLCNFGGPTKDSEVEPFLLRLFEDPFIIRAPLKPAIRSWLARYIARKRTPKATAEYRQIGFSPINRMTDLQARHLEGFLRETRPNTRVVVANRYTSPTADEALKSFDPMACRLFLVTLYPHLCHSTTVSSLRDFDLATERHLGHRDVPSTRVFSWWANPRYVELTYQHLLEGLSRALAASTDPLSIVFSAHGIPLRYHRRGDPYVTEISAHYAELKKRAEAWLQAQDAGLAARCHWHLSFQSRVGPVEWVKPYTDATLAELGRSRGGSLLMVPISFTSDHIETLYEMDHTYRELALRSGFRQYARVRPANDDPQLARALADALLAHGF